MIWQKAFKYPVLIIGIILFTLYIMDPKTSKYWKKQSRRFIPSTCDALMDRSEKKGPENWSWECPGTQLLIIKVEYNDAGEKFPEIRKNLYKQLANSLVKLAQITNPETMPNLLNLKMIIENPRLKILAKTDGAAVEALLRMNTPDLVAEHLKLTVKVKEFVQ